MSAVVLAQVSFFLGFASYKKFLGAYKTINGIGGVCCLTDAQYRGQHSKGACVHHCISELVYPGYLLNSFQCS